MSLTHTSMKNVLLGLSLLMAVVSYSQIKIEAETGTFSGVQVESSIQGYSGSGYVTGFDNDGDKLTITFNTPKTATYKFEITYNATSYKEQELIINYEKQGNIIMPQTTGFQKENVGGVFLQQGVNIITIVKSWGYVQIDNLIFTEVPPHTYTITSSLINSNSDSKTKAVWDYLKSNFGKKVISGQVSYWNELIQLAGKEPKLRAFDFQPYTQGYAYNWDNKINGHAFGWKDEGITEGIIDWYNQTNGCGLVSVQWHWHSPTGGSPGKNTFYTNQTTFSATRAVNPSNAEYSLIIQDIDSIATQLKKLQVAGVPVLWRPLHEAGGAWFWWGAEGSVPALKLWDIVYDRLTNHHQLNNLIWVWSTPEEDWYPGNNKLDVFGFDSYPGEFNYATQKAMFDKYYDISGGQKIIAMTENGPIPAIDALKQQDAMWAYFASWDDLVSAQNSISHIQSSYANSLVITQNDPCGVLTSFKENESPTFSLFPNPAKQLVRFSEIESYSLRTLQGQVIQSGNADHISLSHLASGVYLVEVRGSVKKLYVE